MQDKMKSLITNIKLDAATFHGETVDPTYINFFFGKNGAGKSTVAYAFEHPECLEWQTGVNPADYTILVYNQEFIDRNLANYGDLKGVFTLSEENAETRKQIDEKTEERKDVVADGKQAAEDRDKKSGELKPLRDAFETTCWDDTEDIRKSFDQTQNGKKKKLQFTDEVLSGKHSAVDHRKEDIQKLYDIAYDPKARRYPLFKFSSELEGEYDLTGASHLGEEVTSRSETQFAKFMKALNATEWVKQGHADYVVGHDEGKCPFCQRKLPDDFEKDIAEAFDEGYQKALDALETFETEYTRKMAALLELLKKNLTDVFPKVKTAEYEKLVAQLETLITENEQLIAQKRATPGEPVTLKDTDTIISDIDDTITGINKLIQENNDIVDTKADIDKVRGTEGFPQGSDEDIIELSNAPYYTACPNPFIGEFVKENGVPYDETSDSYRCEPFAADVSEGKKDPVYNAHSYHTKVPYKAIMRYILHYTKPGDVVFDGFCGTGMTAVAAQMCGSSDHSLEFEMTGEFESKQWGTRKSIISDLSPAATYISAVYNQPVDVQIFERAFLKMSARADKECAWMYMTKDETGAEHHVNYTVWSDVFICPHCGKEVVFWDAAVDKETGSVKDKFLCPSCNAEITKKSCERAVKSFYKTYIK